MSEKTTLDELAKAVINTYEDATRVYMEKLTAAHDEYLEVLGTKSEIEQRAASEAAVAKALASNEAAVASKEASSEAIQVLTDGVTTEDTTGLYLSGQTAQQLTDLLGKLAKTVEALSEGLVGK